MGKLCWPGGKKFAFTIVDDTDFSTVCNTQPVYEFLCGCGVSATKTVWPLRPVGQGLTGGGTLEDRDYRSWIERLQRSGIEIALHGVADETSERKRIVRGLERFHSILGQEPAIHTSHVAQGEGIYWGTARLDAPLNWLYRGYRAVRATRPYDGALPTSSRFWGDLCRSRLKYVRNFVFDDINTVGADPLMPYHDPRRPYVRWWFSARNGATPAHFCRLLREANQDRLAEQGGACVVYTHLGRGFHPLPPEFCRLIRRLSRMNGWFPTATQLLDHIGSSRGWRVVGEERRAVTRMQWRWARERSGSVLRKAMGLRADTRREAVAVAPALHDML